MQRDLRVKILGPPHCGSAYIPGVGKGGCKRRESTTAYCERKRFFFMECGGLAAAFTVTKFPATELKGTFPGHTRFSTAVEPQLHFSLQNSTPQTRIDVLFHFE